MRREGMPILTDGDQDRNAIAGVICGCDPEGMPNLANDGQDDIAVLIEKHTPDRVGTKACVSAEASRGHAHPDRRRPGPQRDCRRDLRVRPEGMPNLTNNGQNNIAVDIEIFGCIPEGMPNLTDAATTTSRLY